MPELCLPDVSRNPVLERQLVNRLKRIEGHVRGVQRLIAEHQACEDILIQLGAVKQAINAATLQLLEGHVESCIADSVERGQGAKALASLKGTVASMLRQVG